MGTGGPFPGGKARKGRDAVYSPPSSAEVKYEWGFFLLSPHVLPWHVAGQIYFTLLLLIIIQFFILLCCINSQNGQITDAAQKSKPNKKKLINITVTVSKL
jgi:hypothetical protein